MGNSDQQNEEDKNLITKGHLKGIMIGFGLASMVVIIAPCLLSWPWGIGGFSEGTAHIGDTIGGITAPITGLIGALLVFLALVAQIDANDQIREQMLKQKEESQQQKKVQYIKDDISVLRNELEDFAYQFTKLDSNSPPMQNKGLKAIDELLKKYLQKGPPRHYDEDPQKHPAVMRLLTILDLLTAIAKKITAEIVDPIEQRYLRSTVDLLVSTKLKEPFILHRDKSAENVILCEVCGELHQWPHLLLFYRFEQLLEELTQEPV